MLKFTIILFNTLALLIYQFFFTDGVTVTQKLPSSAKPNSEFIVELTIEKGTTGGFAKLQQELPPGFTAIEDKNNGASFTFSNKTVKFIWMALPNDAEFKVSYKVKVDAGISGEQNIAGKFSYVTDNAKQSVDIAPASITIGEEGGDDIVAEDAEVDAEADAEVGSEVAEPDAVAETKTNEGAETAPFTCVRKAPETAGGEFTVELTVDKGNLSGFAKLLEVLPAGFTATPIESAGASFSFADQKVRYIWVTLPAKPEFKISYKVKIGDAKGDQVIDGVFSYIENDETKKYVIQTSVIAINDDAVAKVGEKTAEETEEVLPNYDDMAKEEPDEVEEKDKDKETNSDEVVKEETAVDEEKDKETNNDDIVKEDEPEKEKPVKTTSKSLAANNIPSPQGNIIYNVQILALRKAKSASIVASLYNLSEATINPVMEGGFRKYLVGSHSLYKDARNARETFKPKGVIAPFVTAYNKGKRITVQEALMVSSQKWAR